MQLDTFTNKFSLAGLMRTVGALLVVAAMCAHLLEGWHAWNDLSRYFAMLGGTVILALAGAVMGYVYKDAKSARAFLGLGLISVVANMTTLGGLIHSLVNGEPVTGSLLLLGVMGASLFLVLLPVAWFAFKVLARPHATAMLGVFGAVSALLLLPFRESLAVGLVIAAAAVLPALYLRRRFGDVALKTLEGRVAVLGLFAPVLVMLGRLLWLYQADEFLTLILSSIAFFASRYVVHLLPEKSVWQTVNGVVSVSLALVIGVAGTLLADGYVAEVALLPIFSATVGGLIWSMGLQHPAARERFAYVGAYWAVSFTVANLLLHFGDGGVACVLVGLLVALGGYRQQIRGIVAAGAVTVTLGMLPATIDLAGLIDFTNWLTLALMGVSVIIAGSVYDRLRRRSAEEG